MMPHLEGANPPAKICGVCSAMLGPALNADRSFASLSISPKELDQKRQFRPHLDRSSYQELCSYDIVFFIIRIKRPGVPMPLILALNPPNIAEKSDLSILNREHGTIIGTS